MPLTRDVGSTTTHSTALGAVAASLVLFDTAMASHDDDAPSEPWCTYDVIQISAGDCPPFGSLPTGASDINNMAQITGYYSLCLGGGDFAYRWSPETGLETVPLTPGNIEMRGHAIDEQGNVAGRISGTSISRAFVWYGGGEPEVVPWIPGANKAYATAIQAGIVYGYMHDSAHGKPPYTAFRWEGRVLTDLSSHLRTHHEAIEAVMGTTGVGSVGPIGEDDQHPLVLDLVMGKSTILPPPDDAIKAIARDINVTGTIVGEAFFPDDPPSSTFRRAFAYQNGEMTLLELPPGPHNSHMARGVNRFGDIVGFTWDDTVAGFVKINGDNTRELNRLVNTEAIVQTAHAINDHGQIAVTLHDGPDSALLNPVPTVAGDLTYDGIVDVRDLMRLLALWGPCTLCPADLDESGAVDSNDLATLLGHWTK